MSHSPFDVGMQKKDNARGQPGEVEGMGQQYIKSRPKPNFMDDIFLEEKTFPRTRPCRDKPRLAVQDTGRAQGNLDDFVSVGCYG